MEQYQQIQAQAKRDSQRKKQGAQQPFEGIVTAVNPRTEVFQSFSHGGQRPVDFIQPFENFSSWIRATPDTGIGLYQTFTSDTKTIIPLHYYTPEIESNRVDSFFNRANVYRPLLSGEIEINSRGLAQSFYGRRGLLEQRGGLIRSWHDQDQLEFGAKAPVIRFKLHQNRSNIIGDEMRFGIVKRPENPSSLSGEGVSNLISQFPKVDGQDENWAKEYLFKLKTLKGNPTYLFDVREGHVHDDNGISVTSTLTNLPLRYDRVYFTKVDTRVREQLDELGNYVSSFPDEAVVGMHTTIPKGNKYVSIGVNEDRFVKVDRNISVGADSFLSVGGNRNINVLGDDGLTVAGNKSVSVDGNLTVNMGTSLNMSIDISAGVINIDSNIPIIIKTPAFEII